MRGNTISLKLQRGRVTQTGSLFQYDYGQRLILLGVDLPSSYEVHFSNSENGSSKTRIGSSEGVDIPDEYLTSGEKIHVWLFLHDGANDGETEYHGIINVTRRATPTDTPPTPVQQDLITQTIAALNAAVEEAEGIAEAIPGTINDALEEAKASGEFDGAPGRDGYTPVKGVDYFDGQDGKDGKDGADGAPGQPGQPGRDGVDGKDGADGKDGQDGAPGEDGYSPTVSVSDIPGGHRVTITDEDGVHTFDVMDGQTPSVPVQDVQVNGTSILSQGVANIPVGSSSDYGVYMVSNSLGINVTNGKLQVVNASSANIKAGSDGYKPVTSNRVNEATFYGLAKAAGNSDQSSSSNAVGVYTEDAKSKISDMLDAPETVNGSTPSINAKPGVRYICGEVSTLTIVAPASGIIDVTFDSGSTPTVLTVTPPTGQTMRWIGDDPTTLEANKHYEINIMDGCNGMVVSWT